MTCPNCDQPMTSVIFDQQSILHCPNCGASFFEENSINRISPETAETLANDRKTHLIFGKQKLCPKDSALLSAVTNEESIPSTVTLFRCDRCRGVFSYADDLLNFKKAQDVKINFFRIWNKPLPALRTVLVFSFLAVFSLLTMISGLSRQKNLSNSQAKDLINKFNVSVSNRYLFVSFTTQIPLKSEIKFINKTSGESFIQSISNTPKTIHVLTTDRVNLNEKIFYQLFLTDEKGRKVGFEEKKLELH